MKKNKKQRLIVYLSVLITLSSLIFVGCTKKMDSLEEFEQTKKNIIKKFVYKDSVDVLTRTKDSLEFYYFEKKELDNQEKFVNTSIVKGDFLFDYQARKKLEGDTLESLEKALRDDIDVIRAVYRGKDEARARYPYYGVSTSQEIKKLSIDDEKVDEVIEYNFQDTTFYVWYFENLELSSTDYKLSLR